MINKESKSITVEYINDTSVDKQGIYLSSFAFLVFITFIFFQRWFDLVLVSSTLQIGVCFLTLCLLLIRPRKSRQIIFNYTTIDVMWIIAIVIIQIYIINAGIAEYNNQFFMYGIGIMFLILAKADIARFKTAFTFIKFMAIFYALATIFHYLFTDVFHGIIFPLAPFSVKQRTLELVGLSYYPGLGFAQPAVSAGYMIIGVGMIISLWAYRSKREKRLDFIYLLLLIIGIVMVGKRSFILWGVGTVLITYYSLSTREKKIGRIVKLLLSVIILFVTLLIISTYFESIPFLTRLIDTMNGIITGEDVTSGRTTLYLGALELFKANPIFGIGWEQFAVVTSGWFFSRDLSVHNVYLQLLTETGLVGFVAVMTPLIYVFYKTYRILKKMVGQEQNYNHLWKVGITFSFYYQTFFLLYCITENPFYNMIFMLMYFFCISIVGSFLVFNSIKNS